MASMSKQIDAMFKNSDYPTEPFTEKQFQANFVSMMGNIKLLFTAVSSGAIVMVILLAAITMSMSARERVTEIAVLKAIGFDKPLVLKLMLTEFVILTVVGGALGSIGAVIVFSFVKMSRYVMGMMPNFTVSGETGPICFPISPSTAIPPVARPPPPTSNPTA